MRILTANECKFPRMGTLSCEENRGGEEMRRDEVGGGAVLTEARRLRGENNRQDLQDLQDGDRREAGGSAVPNRWGLG